MSILAVDMGGTNIKVGLVEQGRVTNTQSIPAHSERGAALSALGCAALVFHGPWLALGAPPAEVA